MNRPRAGLPSLKQALDEVVAASDAARLQLHLLSLEAKQRTLQLGATLENLEQRLDKGLHHALASAAQTARQLGKGVHDSLSRDPPPFGTLRVADVMTDRVQCCSATDTLNRAAQLMWEGDCGAIPVVDAEGRPCGIVTDRDVCMAAFTKDVPLTQIAVGEVMSRHVHSCSADAPLEAAIATMGDAEVRRLPVIDGERHLVGMLSLADIARSASLLGRREAESLTFQLLGALSRRRATAAAGTQLAAE